MDYFCHDMYFYQLMSDSRISWHLKTMQFHLHSPSSAMCYIFILFFRKRESNEHNGTIAN